MANPTNPMHHYTEAVLKAISQADYLEYQTSLARYRAHSQLEPDSLTGLDFGNLLFIAVGRRDTAGFNPSRENDQISIVKDLLPQQSGQPSDYWHRVFETACKFSSLRVIKTLLASGCDITLPLLVRVIDLSIDSLNRDYYVDIVLLLLDYYQHDLSWIWLYGQELNRDGAMRWDLTLVRALCRLDQLRVSQKVVIMYLGGSTRSARRVLSELEHTGAMNTIKLLVRLGLIDEVSLQAETPDGGGPPLITEELIHSLLE